MMERQRFPRRFLLVGGFGLLGLMLALLSLRSVSLDDGLFVESNDVGLNVTPIPAEAEHESLRATDISVQHVGSAVCATCHRNEHQSYLLTAHSRAMGLVNPESEPPDGDFFHAPSQRYYRVFRENGQLWHEESSGITGAGASPEVLKSTASASEPPSLIKQPVKYLVGSGRHSRTYLVENDGFLMESPITWYTSTNDWRMSPGYDHPNHDGFERSADQGCLICHVGRFEPIDGAMNRLTVSETSIGCERCHGPGAAHAEKWKDHSASLRGTVDESDDSIVHPGHLSRDLQEAICSQCHLRGDATVFQRGRSVWDFLPGKPLTDSRIDYRMESDNGEMKVVGHVDQMYASRCYQQSSTLTCTTCHDSHANSVPNLASDFYRNKCMECHGEADCTVSVTERRQQDQSDNCISCHMPQVATDIPHIAFTHHRIGVHGQEPSEKPVNASRGRLVPFGDLSTLTEMQKQRCLGLACAEFSDKQSNPGIAGEYRNQARQLLNGVVENGEADGDVFAVLARYAWEDEHASLAMDYAQRAIADPEISAKARVNSLLIIGDCFLQTRQSAQAVAPLEQLVKLRRNSQDWLLLGISRFQSGAQQAGIEAVKHAAQIQPFRSDVRKTLTDMQRATGK